MAFHHDAVKWFNHIRKNNSSLVYSLLIGLILTLTFLFAFYIRSHSFDSPYVNADDPYRDYRMVNYFIEHKTLPTHDALAYYPIGKNFYNDDFLWYLIPGIIGLIAKTFGVVNPGLFAIHFYPAFFGGLAAVLVYFLSLELFGSRKIGILSSFFVATLPSILQRTVSAVPVKEPIGAVFMIISMIFFVKSLKKFNWIYSGISGVSLLFMMYSWGGVWATGLMYAGFAVAAVLLNKLSKNLTYTYTVSIITFIILGFLSSFIFKGIFAGFTTAHVLIPLGGIVCVWVKEVNDRLKIIKGNHEKWLGTIFIGSVLLLTIIGSFVYTPLGNLTSEYVSKFTSPLSRGTEVVSTTVAYYRPADIGEVVQQNSNAVNAYFVSGIQSDASTGVQPSSTQISFFKALQTFGLFYLAFFALILIGINNIRPLNLWTKNLTKIIFTLIGFAFFLFIFYNILANPIAHDASGNAITPANKDVFGLKFFYWVSFGLFGFSILTLLKRKEENIYPMLFAIMMFATFFYLGWGGVRLIYLTGFGIAIMGAYAIGKFFGSIDYKVLNENNYFSYIFGAILVIGIFAAYTNIASGYVYGKQIGPAMDPIWENALKWVGNNSKPSDVMLSWWDYGYIIQFYADRPTYVDPGNEYTYRNHEVAQIFTATNETGKIILQNNSSVGIIDWLKSYNIKYIIQDSAMVGKYSAVSTIASNGANTDQYPVFRRGADDCLQPGANQSCIKVAHKFDRNDNGDFFRDANGNPTGLGISVIEDKTNNSVRALFTSGNSGQEIPICTPSGDKINVGANTMPGCVIFGSSGAVVLGYRYDATKGQAAFTDLSTSLFTQMWFFDAQKLSHFKLVHTESSNGGSSVVKVYEVIY